MKHKYKINVVHLLWADGLGDFVKTVTSDLEFIF